MRLFKAVCLLVTVGIVTTLSALGWAQTQVQTRVSSDTVEVGQRFSVKMKATGDERPEQPQLTVPQGFRISDPSVGTSQQISIVNGQVTKRIGLNATWRVTATRPGKFTLGPASVNTPQGRVTGNTVKVEVVPHGTLPQKPSRRDPSGLLDDDLFPGLGQPGKSLFDDLFGNRRRGMTPNAPPEYQVQHAPDPTAFLRAVVHPRRAVVGQQVTLSIYAYGSRGRFNETNPSEPRRPDFYSYPLVERSGRQPVYVTEIDGRHFHTQKVREIALFPLTAGTHEIGPMSMHFYGRRYVSPRNPEGIERSSKPLQVQVDEPPQAGRPAGYALGDVGRYRLDARVEPRRVAAGESVSVVVILNGQGNLPSHVLTPEQKGVEWLNPTIEDRIKASREGHVGGRRVFNYVVRLMQPGQVDLGEVTLPHYDPQAGAYRTARADLGSVVVTESKQATSEQQPEQTQKLSALAEVRHELSEYQAPGLRLADRPWYWILMALAPASVLLTQFGQHYASALWRRHRKKRESSWQHTKEALNNAQDALKQQDTKTSLSKLERAIFMAIESATGLKARAVLRDELQKQLQDAGLERELAAELCQLLQQADVIRFGGEQSSVPATRELLKRTRVVLKKLRPRGTR